MIAATSPTILEATPQKVFSEWRLHSLKIDNFTGVPTGHAEIIKVTSEGESLEASTTGIALGNIYAMAANNPDIQAALSAVTTAIFGLASEQGKL